MAKCTRGNVQGVLTGREALNSEDGCCAGNGSDVEAKWESVGLRMYTKHRHLRDDLETVFWGGAGQWSDAVQGRLRVKEMMEGAPTT